MTLGKDGNVYLAGDFQGTVNFDPKGSYDLTSLRFHTNQGGGMEEDLCNEFVTQLDPNGKFAWTAPLGSEWPSEEDSAPLVAVDQAGSIYLVASAAFSADLDPIGRHTTTGNYQQGNTNLDGGAEAFYITKIGQVDPVL